MGIRKVQIEKSTGPLIALYWPTQAWLVRLKTMYYCTGIVYPPDNEAFFVGSTVHKPCPLVIAKIRLGRNPSPAFEVTSSVETATCFVMAEEKRRRDSCQAWLDLTPLGIFAPAKLPDGCASATKTCGLDFQLKKMTFSPTSIISLLEAESAQNLTINTCQRFPSTTNYSFCIPRQRRHWSVS